jgi:hypothetical protein
MVHFREDLWLKVMDKSIFKEENFDGEIYGDLGKEYQISLGNKEKQEKDCGDYNVLSVRNLLE